ncbi:MAG: esterase family protein, partial [Sphingobacteriaceae bacterium]
MTTHRRLLRTTFFLLIITAVFTNARAAVVDTALTYSAAMKKNIKAVVIKPDGYNKDQTYPVLYLLHGYGGNYADWISKVPAIKNLADQYKFIIVCPDGNFGSWYFDSPVDPAWKYETYVATELVTYIDKNYSTIKNRSGRAITGLSMG